MTSLQHHIVTQSHSSTGHLDNNLDALLDDLQTSVSRSGTVSAFSNQNGHFLNESNFGGHINLPPGATGYREITTMVTRDTNGMPTTSRDYQIEYLNPANSVTVLNDRSSSPAIELLKSGDLAGHQLQSYKTEVYDYKFSKTTSDNKTTKFGPNQIGANDAKNLAVDSTSYYQSDPNVQSSSQFSRAQRSERTENFQGQTSAGKNLNELDMLLKELNTTAPHGDSKEYFQTFESKSEKSSGRYPESPSSMPKRCASATRELNYSERTQNRTDRAQSPTVLFSTPKASTRTISVQREESSRSHTSRRDSPSARNRSAEMSPILRRQTPSPSPGEFRPANFNNYPISPKDLTPTKTINSKSYSFSSTGRKSPTSISFDEPQPYRSPSPVSFPQRRSPSPIRRNLNRSDSGRSASYQVRGGDQSQGSSEFTHKIEYAREYRDKPDQNLQRSPSFERNLRPSNVKMTQSYAHQQQQQSQEYTNQYHQNEKPSSFRKEYQRREEFHTREQHSGHYNEQPQPQQQQREYYQQNQYQQYQQSQGKYQQESREQYQQNQGGIQRENREFSQQGQDGYHHDQKYQYEQNKQYRQHSTQIPVNESMTSQAYKSGTASKSVAGPPVYYPPGVELFTKKEEAMLKQEQSGKKGKSKSKKNKNKDKKGIKTYPACFPLCCAMPCSIM